MNEKNTIFRKNLVEKYLLDFGFFNELKESYKGKTILVTGGAGAIGSNLTIALSALVGDKGRVIVLDNLSSSKTKNPWNIIPMDNVLFVYGDISDDIILKRLFHEKLDLVFHLAAFFANQNSVDYPENSANTDITGLIKILEYSVISQVDRFIYASSGCSIYGSHAELPVKEDFISMHLTTPYQINKMAGEMYCNFYNHHYGLETVNCRFFNSYGPGEIPGQYRNVIPNFIYWSMNDAEIPITGEGTETRDFTYVLDLVQGLLKSGVSDKCVGENFNLSAGKEISIMEMAKKVSHATGKELKIDYRPRRKWDTKMRMLASTDKAKKIIGYEPKVDFDDGFLKNVEWFKMNWDQIKLDADFNPGMNSAARKA